MRKVRSAPCEVSLVLLCLTLCLQAHFAGCRKSGGVKVCRAHLPTDRVKTIVVYPAGGFLEITDRAIVSACVAEIEGLSWTPYQPANLRRLSVDFDFSDERGKTLFRVGVADGDYIMFFQRGFVPSAVRYEIVPTLGKLLSYARLRQAHRALLSLSRMPEWEKESRSEVRLEVRSYNSNRGPGVALPMPGSPAELRDALKDVPPLNLQELANFPDAYGRQATKPAEARQ